MALRRSPDNAEALNNLAWMLALRSQDRTSEALELINRAIEMRGPTSSLVDTRAVVLIRAGQPNRAIEGLTIARATDPKNPSLAVHLAWAYQMASNRQEAINAFRLAEKLGLRLASCDPLERSFVEKLRKDLGL
jgi:predicted Zn-dependent protease